MNSIKKVERIQRVFARGGIRVEREGATWRVHNTTGEARILLPEGFPLESKTVEQLLHFASVSTPDGHSCVCQACATPDFHPGSTVPVGTVVATPSDMVIPQAIGTDINCGMRLLSTDVPALLAQNHMADLERGFTHVLLHGNRDVPLPSSAFRSLVDQGPSAMLSDIANKGLWQEVDLARIEREIQRCVRPNHPKTILHGNA